MAKNPKTVLLTKNLSDAFYHLKSISGLQVLGACTATEQIGDKVIILRNISELQTIDKHEQYIDFSSQVTLSNMIKLGKTNMPPVLYDALMTIATEPVRNIATLGGNICAQGVKHTLYAPLLALDARLEFRTATETRQIPFSRFTEIPKGFILTKIRIPSDEFELSIFKRTGPAHTISDMSAGFAFLVDTQNDIIANIRIVYAGQTVFHSRTLENRIIGTRLPLNEKFISSLLLEASKIFEEENKDKNLPPILHAQFQNLLHWSFEQLR